MAFCKNCGAECVADAKFCKQCGTPIEAPAYEAPAAPAYEAPAAPAYEAPAYTAPAYEAPAYTAPATPAAPETAKPSIVPGIVGLALGATCVEFSFFCLNLVMLFFSIPCGIVGLIMSKNYLSALEGKSSPNPIFGRIGIICSAVGMGMSALLGTIGFFIWLANVL